MTNITDKKQEQAEKKQIKELLKVILTEYSAEEIDSKIGEANRAGLIPAPVIYNYEGTKDYGYEFIKNVEDLFKSMLKNFTSTYVLHVITQIYNCLKQDRELLLKIFTESELRIIKLAVYKFTLQISSEPNEIQFIKNQLVARDLSPKEQCYRKQEQENQVIKTKKLLECMPIYAKFRDNLTCLMEILTSDNNDNTLTKVINAYKTQVIEKAQLIINLLD